jgi:hypothetical protein
MSHFYRVFKMLFFAAAVFFLAAVPSSAASKVPPVSNLTLVTNEADRVKLDWDAPSTAGLGDATIDQYIIKRNGHTISTLVGFNGLVDTAYVDGGRSQDDATYSVTAVDSKGRRSKPAEIVVPAAAAPVQDQTPGPTNDTGPPDVIQSSGFCDAIIPPNIMGGHAGPCVLPANPRLGGLGNAGWNIHGRGQYFCRHPANAKRRPKLAGLGNGRHLSWSPVAGHPANSRPTP